MKAAASERFVLDASVAVAWCFEDEATRFTESILDSLAAGAEAVVPALWGLEVANALLVAERRQRITQARLTALLQRMGGLPILTLPVDQGAAFSQVLPVARQHGLSVYDAAYLELAVRLGLPLASLDDQLCKAARKTGVQLLS